MKIIIAQDTFNGFVHFLTRRNIITSKDDTVRICGKVLVEIEKIEDKIKQKE